MEQKKSTQMQRVLLIAACGLCVVLAALLAVLLMQNRALRQQIAEHSAADSAGTESSEAVVAGSQPVGESGKALYQAQCSEIAYDMLVRGGDDLINSYFTFTGKIVQAMEGQYRLALHNNNNYSDIVYLEYIPPTADFRLIKDDMVMVWGQSLGMYTYTSVSEAQITVPRLQVAYAELLSEEQLAALDAIRYTRTRSGQSVTARGCTLTLTEVLQRPATEDDTAVYSDKQMIFLLLDVMNSGDESAYITRYGFTPYVDSYLAEFVRSYENPDDLNMLGTEVLEPEHGMRGFVALLADRNAKTVELNTGEDSLRVTLAPLDES